MPFPRTSHLDKIKKILCVSVHDSLTIVFFPPIVYCFYDQMFVGYAGLFLLGLAGFVGGTLSRNHHHAPGAYFDKPVYFYACLSLRHICAFERMHCCERRHYIPCLDASNPALILRLFSNRQIFDPSTPDTFETKRSNDQEKHQSEGLA